jgi:hypothetical protein
MDLHQMAKLKRQRHISRTYSIDEVADLLGIGRNSAFAAAGKDFPAIRVGKRLLVPKVALDRLLGVEGEPVLAEVKSAESA